MPGAINRSIRIAEPSHRLLIPHSRSGDAIGLQLHFLKQRKHCNPLLGDLLRLLGVKGRMRS
jgi:hypothetical protein